MQNLKKIIQVILFYYVAHYGLKVKMLCINYFYLYLISGVFKFREMAQTLCK